MAEKKPKLTPDQDDSTEKQFLNFYQRLQFSGELDPHKSIDNATKRFYAFSNEMAKSVCNETQLLWMDIHLRKINSEIDRFDTKDSINNNCDSISRLVKQSRKETDAPKWQSSLSMMDESSFNSLLSPTEGCKNANIHEKSKTVQSLVQVLLANNDNSKNQPPSPPSVMSSSYKKIEKSNNVFEQKAKGNILSTVEPAANKTGPPSDFRNEPNFSKPTSKTHFSAPAFTKNSNNKESMDVDMDERFSNHSTTIGVGTKLQSFSRNSASSFETNHQRGKSKNYGSSSASSTSNNIFRTATEELKVQNMNKYGNANGPYNTESNSTGYGNYQKKSLGGLGGRPRTVTSKFKPPIPTEDNNWNSEDTNMDRGNPSGRSDQLKCIDEKMIELIENEIMDQGTPITWEDIAGLEFAKKTIQEIVVLPFLRPDLFTGLRSPPKGILLFGPPGTGKTLIGKCIASESESTFFSISASSLTSKWIGDGEKMVRALFAVARTRQPSVIFIDEIDSLLSQRSDTEHESSRRMKTEFLVQLDGATTGEDDRILIIGATNRPQELDEAARRRLIKRLYIPLPDKTARIQIVTRLMSTERNDLTEEQIDHISNLTDGYSGADMKCVCKEASLEPIRSIDISRIKQISAHDVRPIMIDDFMAALSRVKSSVSAKDLDQYLEWDKLFGSGGTAK